ncbi:Ger(x)C family spore germination protein [Cohnella yongneupensis]|uniref:Ger(X)C family spore germination protein n=1 Tax=Cohnella yongneupensis TaxID=425006 RepID=A0ABW0R6Y7_9BACL
MVMTKYLMTFVLLAVCCPLSGCWNRREMNDLAIVLAAGVDRVGKQYLVTVQVADPSQMIRPSPGNRASGIVYSEKALTVYEALRKITTKSPRQLYYGHLSMLFLNESAAREGFSEFGDLFFRMPETRPDFDVVVTHKVSSRDMLSMVPPFEIAPALDFFKSLQISEQEWAPTSSASIFDLMHQISTDGWEPALTAITMVGDRKGAMSQDNVKQPRSLGEYKYEGIAVFKDDKLIGIMNEEDSKSYSYMRNKVASTVAHLHCPSSDDEMTVEINEAKSRIVPLIRNGEPYAQIRMHFEVALAECDCKDLDLTKDDAYRKIENAGRETVDEIVGGGIRHVQEKFGSDIYGFGAAFHRKYPKHWNGWKDDWNQYFSKMPIELIVDYHVRKIGEITNPVQPANRERK